nr:Ig-like domain-containing protein [Pseudoalteromonas piscicida]
MDTEHNSAMVFTHSKLQTHIKAALLCSAAIQLPVAVASSTLANTETLRDVVTHTTVNQQALDYVQSKLTSKPVTVTRDPSWGRLEFLSQCTGSDPLCSSYTNEFDCLYNLPFGTCTWGTPSNNPPSFNSNASTNFAENGTGTVLDVNAVDGDGGSNDSGITYSLSGTDASQFSINSSSGVITFKTAPDYESPGDNGGDNIYNITVTANDGGSSNNTATQNITITVTDIDEVAPTFDGGNSTPNDNATGVSGSSSITIDFNENIVLGTGNITIRDVSGSSDFEVFDVATESDGTTTSPSAGRIGITNDKIYINPTNDLTGNRDYAIRIDATAVDDSAGNSFAGISDDTTFNFSTANTAPAVDLDSTSGSDNSSASFSEGGGAVNIAANAAVTEADGDTITTITVSLTNDQDGASEGLNVSASAQDALTGISGSSDISLQDTISITGATASASEVQTFLQAITYNNTSSSPNETARIVTVVINDGTVNSTSRTATISVNNVTAASSTAASFNTTNGTNLSPSITFTSDDETLTIADTSHIAGSTADGAEVPIHYL